MSIPIATESQLQRIAAHGCLEDRDYSIADASSIISELEKTGEAPNWAMVKQSAGLIGIINVRQLTQSIKNNELALESEGLDAQRKREIREDIRNLKQALREFREDQRQEKEDEKLRLQDLQEELGPYGGWSQYVKKPNQTQLKDCLDALDSAYPNWEMEKGLEPLVATLSSNYPQLVKKNAPKEKTSKGSGCLVLIVGTFIIGTTLALNIMG